MEDAFDESTRLFNFFVSSWSGAVRETVSFGPTSPGLGAPFVGSMKGTGAVAAGCSASGLTGAGVGSVVPAVSAGCAAAGFWSPATGVLLGPEGGPTRPLLLDEKSTATGLEARSNRGTGRGAFVPLFSVNLSAAPVDEPRPETGFRSGCELERFSGFEDGSPNAPFVAGEAAGATAARSLMSV